MCHAAQTAMQRAGNVAAAAAQRKAQTTAHWCGSTLARCVPLLRAAEALQRAAAPQAGAVRGVPMAQGQGWLLDRQQLGLLPPPGAATAPLRARPRMMRCVWV